MTHVLRCSGYYVVITDIVRGEGSDLYDIDGKRYVDLESGVWCTSVGHGNTRILRALEEQYDRAGLPVGVSQVIDELVEAACAGVCLVAEHQRRPLAIGHC